MVMRSAKGSQLPFYIDDLKAYDMNVEQLKNLLDIAKTFSADINVEFELDKCAVATFVKCKLTKSSNIVLNQHTIRKDLIQEGACKYRKIKKMMLCNIQ